ncbi:putative addiction module killer protein [Neorhizobium huautlense]|uniref:Addiction module killer protein n=1 Tax=Neorhizobium huautlense TaxID=67774 RepID=A0ABT9PV72_9HYPH|nr:type II toxin-antitoxin system RelE/ParE family toxin [Neorhizobium huautlense]MDP9838363.1 putative addiction module killer protein [Neorhizobium huautlense]
MMQAVKADEYRSWLKALADARAKARISIRVDRLIAGNPGDVKPVGEGVSEMRIDYGPGYRVYYMRRGAALILLLCGGDKNTQNRDIRTAKRLAREWKED